MEKKDGVLIDVKEDDLELLKSNPDEFWEGVTKIGEYAFDCCSNLTSITIPDSVTEIERDAFRCCKSLTSINIPNSMTWIGIEAFAYCSSLTSINIPNSVTEIKEGAFSGCSNLREIILPEGVEIAEDAFENCPNLKITWVKANEKATSNESETVKPVSRFRKMLEKLGKLFRKPDEQESSFDDENE